MKGGDLLTSSIMILSLAVCPILVLTKQPFVCELITNRSPMCHNVQHTTNATNTRTFVPCTDRPRHLQRPLSLGFENRHRYRFQFHRLLHTERCTVRYSLHYCYWPDQAVLERCRSVTFYCDASHRYAVYHWTELLCSYHGYPWRSRLPAPFCYRTLLPYDLLLSLLRLL
jgi:hypothetical protein